MLLEFSCAAEKIILSPHIKSTCDLFLFQMNKLFFLTCRLSICDSSYWSILVRDAIDFRNCFVGVKKIQK